MNVSSKSLSYSMSFKNLLNGSSKNCTATPPDISCASINYKYKRVYSYLYARKNCFPYSSGYSFASCPFRHRLSIELGPLNIPNIEKGS